MKLSEKYLYSQCAHPVKVRVTNPITLQEEVREFPCGKCLHCRITKVEEWSTRMICESTMYKHVYFVTLTYDSAILAKMPKVAEEVHAVVHSFNYKGVSELAPLTLCKRHTQLFWKRLRKNTGVKLSYYLVGEYGHKYGRPHYHAIVWTDDVITDKQFFDAWQLCSPQSMKIVDLKDNKNLKDQIKSFRYVTKYLFKDFKFENIPTYSLHRGLSDNMSLCSFQDFSYLSSEIDKPFVSYRDVWDSEQRKYVHTLVFEISQLPYSYETQKNAFFAEVYRKEFGCFSTCSKSPAIGSRYLQKYSDEYKKGNFRVFGIHTKGSLIFPSFFVRKTKEMVQPCRLLSAESGNPTAPSSMSSLLAYVDRLQDYIGNVPSTFQVDSDCRYVDKASVLLRERIFDGLFDFYDSHCKQYYIRVGDRYCVYHWNRHKRDYVLDCVEMFDTVYQRIKILYKALFDTFLKPFDEIHRLYEQAKQNYIDTVFGSEEAFKAEVDRLYDILLKNRSIQQEQYKLTKQLF